MTRLIFISAMLAAATFLSACKDKEEAPITSAAPAPPANAAPPVLDVGKLTRVTVKAEGLGTTAAEAVSQAMKMAILQVNGAAIQSESIGVKYGLDVTLGKESASLRAHEFVEAVRQSSGGVIQNFKILDLQEPSLLTRKLYKASIEADIAKFEVSAEMQKIKLVVGPIRFEHAMLPMGDRSISASEVATTLRQRISDALVQTGRFAVLDREFSPEIEQELNMISSGQAPSAELAKLSQAASADIVWSGRISNLAYNRHARQLKTSDRELVSYSGGWAMTQKLVNVATRQVVASDALRGNAPSTQASTLSTGVDSARVLQNMSDDLVAQVVNSVMRRTFPIMVVARDGESVVLSQGGKALKEGTRYAMVTMGKEMKDPQTGQSLGRIESPCCELLIERVTPNLSYGRLENVRSNLDNLPEGGLQLREELKATGDLVASPKEQTSAGSVAPSSTTKPRASTQANTSSAAPKSNADDDKW